MKKKLNVRVGMCLKFFDEILIVTKIIGDRLIWVKKYNYLIHDFEGTYMNVEDIQLLQLKEIEI